MKQIDVMKQALEATEVLKSLFRQAEARHAGLFPSPNVVCQITVEDLRKGLYAADALHTAIAEAEKQEPVAELWDVCEGEPVILWKKDWRDVSVGTKFYTHSAPTAQREWVGLTDEEIALVCAECAASAHNWNDISFARAIEAKLKEKNT